MHASVDAKHKSASTSMLAINMHTNAASTKVAFVRASSSWRVCSISTAAGASSCASKPIMGGTREPTGPTFFRPTAPPVRSRGSGIGCTPALPSSSQARCTTAAIPSRRAPAGHLIDPDADDAIVRRAMILCSRNASSTPTTSRRSTTRSARAALPAGQWSAAPVRFSGSSSGRALRRRRRYRNRDRCRGEDGVSRGFERRFRARAVRRRIRHRGVRVVPAADPALNLLILVGTARVFRSMHRGEYDEAESSVNSRTGLLPGSSAAG